MIIEICNEPEGWDGWYVALDEGEVVGAIGGGLSSQESAEVYVLYVSPSRLREGIGTLLLNHLTEIQNNKGASQQWVSVFDNNGIGIPFYESQGFKFAGKRDSHGNQAGDHYESIRYVRSI